MTQFQNQHSIYETAKALPHRIYKTSITYFTHKQYTQIYSVSLFLKCNSVPHYCMSIVLQTEICIGLHNHKDDLHFASFSLYIYKVGYSRVKNNNNKTLNITRINQKYMKQGRNFDIPSYYIPIHNLHQKFLSKYTDSHRVYVHLCNQKPV